MLTTEDRIAEIEDEIAELDERIARAGSSTTQELRKLGLERAAKTNEVLALRKVLRREQRGR